MLPMLAILAAVPLVAATGVGNDTSSGPVAAEAGEDVTLTVWSWRLEDDDA